MFQSVFVQSLMSTVAITLQYLVYSRSNFQWYAGKPLDSANQGCTCTWSCHEMVWQWHQSDCYPQSHSITKQHTHTPIQQTNLECKFMDLTLFTPMTSLCANVRNQKQSLQASINFTAFFDTAALKNVPIWIQGTPLKKWRLGVIASLQSTSMR